MPRRGVAQVRLPMLVVAIGMIIAACTVGPSQRPGLVVAGTTPGPTSRPSAPNPTVPPLEKPGTDAVPWTDCTTTTKQRLGSTVTVPAGLTFQCAKVISSLDTQDAPDEGLVRLELLKVGTGPTPLLVVNDLDGMPGTLYAAQLAGELPAPFLTTFSLIGMDRRGTGGSDGVHCVPETDREQIISYDPTDTNLTGLLNASLDASQQCVLALDTRASALDIAHTAQDVETVRQELGVHRLDAIGHGEGSRVLTTYADRYPTHVGRFVLDGSPDPTLDSTDTAQTRAASAQATFAAFAAACQARGNCPLGADPTATVQRVLTRLRTQPVELPDGTTLTNGTALNAVLLGLADPTRWPQLATAIAQAGTGDGTGLAAFVVPVVSGTTIDPARLDADLVSGCNDESDRLAPAQVSSTMSAWTKAYPLFGGLLAQDLLLCAPWPVPSQPVPLPTAKGAPPIVVLSTQNDPVTPGSGSVKTAQELDDGVLVRWLGSGHGALGQSACATQAAQNFLIAAQVPENPTTCPP